MMAHPLLNRSRVVALATTLALALGPGGLLPLGAAVAAPIKRGGTPVTLNFVNADIEGVARAISAIVDRQILIDPRVKGTVTLYSEQPLSPREAFLNFLTALRGQGFALVEVAGLLKVVPEADAKLQTGTVVVGNRGGRVGDQVLTQIFKLQYESANSLVTVLRPLISPNNTINANVSTNTLVITDYADNLRRIGQMIAAMDVPATTDMEAIPLKHAIAADLAPVVQRFADSGSSAPGGTQAALVMADSRTNTLMIRAANPSRLAMVRSLVQRLDRPGVGGLGGSGINVVYLRNADATKLAQVLRAAFPAGSSGGGSSAGSSPNAPPTTPSASTTGGGNSGSGASTQSTAPVGASAQPSTGGFIQADPGTNSLIITAPDALYRQLRAVIDQLDGRRAQIYIESIIVQIDADKSADLGVQWQGLLSGDSRKNGVGIASNFGGAKGIASTLAGTGASALGVLKDGLNVGLLHDYGGVYSLAALANFLQSKGGVNLLSTPNLVSLDGEEAKIVIGKNVPFVSGSYANSGGGPTPTNPFNTVERKDVGLTLRVRPQVGEGGTVRMTVYQENSDVIASSAKDSNGPTTTKSAIETTVVVDDGQVLVLGGLLKDQFETSQSQIPLLGDIPVVGALFKSQSRSRTKSNLMVFLRPVIMRTQDASNALTLDRYEYIRKLQMGTVPDKSYMLPINEVPVLPELKLSNDLEMPSVRQPLDEPGAPAPMVLMPSESGFLPRLSPSLDASTSQAVKSGAQPKFRPLPPAVAP